MNYKQYLIFLICIIFISCNKTNINSPDDIIRLELVYPAGGENIVYSGIPLTIKWVSKNINKVNIYYSLMTESVWELIADSVSADDGSYDWDIKNMSPDAYKIKITDYNDLNLFDQTENPFTISYDPGIINASKYYPLTVGNRWVYKARYQQSYFPPSIDTTYFIERKIISDTTYEDGEIYFKLSETDHYKQKTEIYFERIDYRSGNVYRRYQDNAIGEVLIDSLLAKAGDRFMGHRFTLPNTSYYMYTELLESTSATYFGVTYPVNKYRESETFSVFDYFLVENIGLGNYYEGRDLSTLDARLNGCLINNVVYGDTTVSY